MEVSHEMRDFFLYGDLWGIVDHPAFITLLGLFGTYLVGEKFKNQFEERKSKGRFTLNFVRLAYARIFWSSVYLSRTERGRPREKIDEAYEKLNFVLERWNIELLGTTCLFEKYYPKKGYKHLIENEVTTNFWNLQTGIEAIHSRILNGDDAGARSLAQKTNSNEWVKTKDQLKEMCDSLDYEFEGIG